MARNMMHPLTGQPIKPVYIDKHGRARYPFIGAADDPAPDPAPKPDPQNPEPDPSKETYPANTPVDHMTPAQQAAYWKANSRKHEDRNKALGNITPEDLKALREAAKRQEDLEHELLSDKDKAVAEASKTTQAAADAQYRPLLAETAFRVAIGDRKDAAEVDEFIADLNLARFINDDGRVDTAKVLARVEQFAPAKGIVSPRGPALTGATIRPGDAKPSVSAGQDLWEERHPQRTSN